jgi:hypothetical protein
MMMGEGGGGVVLMNYWLAGVSGNYSGHQQERVCYSFFVDGHKKKELKCFQVHLEFITIINTRIDYTTRRTI